MGLKAHEIAALKTKFHNSLVESLGGQEVLARRGVIVIIEIEVVYAD
jgi:hypothetical protein